jgi:geranylgeranyl diphosphate synthase type II
VTATSTATATATATSTTAGGSGPTRARRRDLVSDTLDEYGTRVRRALADYLPTEEPRRYLYDLISDYPRRGGKMMRPSLCLAAAGACGASRDEALNAAVAIELLHNALLVHDDIEDESEERRGRPTLHRIHGTPLAINAGDALGLMSFRPLLENRLRLGPRLMLKIVEEVEQMARESAEGQALELGWQRENVLDLDDSDYLEMVLKKTCWLATIFPLRIGLLIGSREVHRNLEPVLRFGFFLGAAFQIHDDVLNLTADARYGKEPDGDVYEGKRTLILLHLLGRCRPEERSLIGDFLARPRSERRPEEVERIRLAMDRCGSIEHARGVARGLAGAARHEFELAFGGLPASRDLAFIERLATWVIERET